MYFLNVCPYTLLMVAYTGRMTVIFYLGISFKSYISLCSLQFPCSKYKLYTSDSVVSSDLLFI